MTEDEFWRLVDDSKVSEARPWQLLPEPQHAHSISSFCQVIISSWSEKQLIARVEGRLAISMQPALAREVPVALSISTA